MQKTGNYKSQFDELLVRRSIVDAAINEGAALPEDIIDNMYSNDAIVLLAQSPKNYANAILSRFRRETNSVRWIALSNLLGEIKEGRFPLVLMEDMKVIPVTALVHDPGNKGPGGIGGGYGHGINDFKIPAGFPPIGVYDILADYNNSVIPGPGIVHTFSGPHTIYITRRMINPGDMVEMRAPNASDSGFWPEDRPVQYRDDWNCFRWDFLSSYLNLPKENIYFHVDVSWINQKLYIESVRSYCSRILQKFDHILALLQDQNLISPSETDIFNISISLQISDIRSNKKVALPAIRIDRVIVQ